MKAILAVHFVAAAAVMSLARAADSTATVETSAKVAADRALDSRALRYDGKDLEQWLQVLATELKEERQTEALEALGGFAANGRSKEAASAIAHFMNKPSRLSAHEKAQNRLVSAAVRAITRAEEADVMALVPDSAQLGGDPTAEFWRRAQAHFAPFSKSYEVAELLLAQDEKSDVYRDLSRFVSELKAQFPPRTWHEDGGKCDIAPFETNQAVVVSAPLRVHRAMDKVLANMRQTRPLTRSYDVGHLLPTKASITRAKHDFEALVDLITTTIHPTSWESGGGAGSIRQDHSAMMLVVSRLPVETHEEIADLLQQLTALAGKSHPEREETKVKR